MNGLDREEYRRRGQRIAELESALARADELLIQHDQVYAQKAEWYEQALQEQQAKIDQVRLVLARAEDNHAGGYLRPATVTVADVRAALEGK